MNAAARRSGRRADIQALDRRRISAARRTQKKLSQIGRAATDVAPDVIGVVSFERGGRHNIFSDNTIAEAGRETLDLIFYPFGHIECRAVRNVAVSPSRVFSRRRAARVEKARLRQ